MSSCATSQGIKTPLNEPNRPKVELSEASGTPTCKDVIKACDKALNAKQEQVDATTKELANTQQKLKESDDKLNSPFRNPFLLILLGLIGGVAITK